MSGIQVKLIRDKPGKCPECGEVTVTEVYANWCKPCRGKAYLEFRDAMNWPLDVAELRRLGFIP